MLAARDRVGLGVGLGVCVNVHVYTSYRWLSSHCVKLLVQPDPSLVPRVPSLMKEK